MDQKCVIHCPIGYCSIISSVVRTKLNQTNLPLSLAREIISKNHLARDHDILTMSQWFKMPTNFA